MHYTGNLYRLVSVNLFEQIRLSHKSFKLETLKDIRGDIVRFYIPHTHIFVVQSAPKFISQRPYVEIDTQRSHTCSYFHLDLDPHCTSSAVCETAFRLRSHTYIYIDIAMGTHISLQLFPTISFPRTIFIKSCIFQKQLEKNSSKLSNNVYNVSIRGSRNVF